MPTSRRLISAVLDLCPETIGFAPAPRKHPVNPLRPLWRQAAMYMLLLIPGAALAFFTGAMMLLRASELALPLSVVGLTLAACGMFAAGLFLLYRAIVAVTTCPWINEEGVRAGVGVYMPWEDVHFGYVHRRAQVSGMFLLSQPLEAAGRHGEQAVYCLSLRDASTWLTYLTCPAGKGIGV